MLVQVSDGFFELRSVAESFQQTGAITESVRGRKGEVCGQQEVRTPTQLRLRSRSMAVQSQVVPARIIAGRGTLAPGNVRIVSGSFRTTLPAKSSTESQNIAFRGGYGLPVHSMGTGRRARDMGRNGRMIPTRTNCAELTFFK